MKNRKVNLLSSNKAIEERALEVYDERLKPNKMKDHLINHEEVTNKLCEARIDMCKLVKTDPWTQEDLKVVLKQLKNDKARDAENLANEIFKEKAAGTDLLKAVLKLMNLMKENQTYPKILEKCNITSIHKKNSNDDVSNYRGVFRVNILRSILDRLIYNSCYETIDSSLTDGNVGARKRRGCRDNIFVLSAINNSILKGNSEPIQLQVTDVKTCFDKLWLQSCTNALFECGLRNNMLSLMFLENRNVQYAIKVNNKLTRRVNAQDVELQGSVWSSLKCTSMMDTLNKIVMTDEDLQYHYKGDKDVPIGVRGMVDDTLGISKCGNKAVQLNAVINSFVESQRLLLSKEKSVVIHVGKKTKCDTPCPILQVHENVMHEADSVKYLGNIVTPTGGLSETIEDRRNKGWGKVATILGILDEVDMGSRRIEAGLLLRKSILVNSLLFTSETWSGIREASLQRLEQVDQALLRSLLAAHSKTSVEFLYLESGSLQLKHILRMNRMMYHHYLLTLDKEETIRKIYEKQKQEPNKGDWYELLKSDFEFVEKEICEDEIQSLSKIEYKKIVKELIQQAVFKYYLKKKVKHTKLDQITYNTLKVQSYLTDSRFSREERELVAALRSRCYNAKLNFRKLHKGNLQCSLGCPSIESQFHIFSECKVLKSDTHTEDYNSLFSDVNKQKQVINTFIYIEKKRQFLRYSALPWD